jgi:acyl-CoA reductase-like NAD-dependent aldehyde dehydrogenase
VVAGGDVLNIVGGKAVPARSGAWLEKVRPADETVLCRVARSSADDVADAVVAARAAQPGWAERTAVARGDVVRELALLLRGRREEASAIVVEETGKPEELALGETDAAVEMGLFVAG